MNYRTVCHESQDFPISLLFLLLLLPQQCDPALATPPRALIVFRGRFDMQEQKRVKLIHSQINIVTLICIRALHNQIYKLHQICPVCLGVSWMCFLI